MMKSNIYRITQLLLLVGFMLLTSSCRETIGRLFPDDMEAGDEVNFTAFLQERTATTRATETPVPSVAYRFTIGMYTDDTHQVGDNGIYTVGEDGGVLKAVTPLYWPDNTTAYGFKAVAGSDSLNGNQSTKADWLLQDRLEGGTSAFYTNKDWKKATNGSTTIPLDVKHTRSLITIILKAGKGVSRDALAYNVAENDLSASIFSYTADANSTKLDTLQITPLASETKVDYAADKNGAAKTGVSSTRYDAIVEPWDYSAKPSEYLLARISLSGQKYSFYAQNDDSLATKKAYYDLQAGQHLTITITLGRNGRETLMSAYLEDWTEEVTTTICDDNGNAGDPIKINSRDELIAFLSDNKKNKAGNVAMVTTGFDLDTYSETFAGKWDAYNKYDLNCTLNLGHHTLTGNSRFLNKIGNAGSLLNGTIQIGGTVDAAIAKDNNGTIDDVKITASNGVTAAYATVAGAVIANTGTISKCSSALKVVGTTAKYVGGIAATSTTSASKASVIDGCTVTNRVSSSNISAKVGGIVGRANGYVTNNTFEYGITLLQDNNHQNIVGEKNIDHTSTFTGNAWPTTDDNLGMDNAYVNPYNGIISTTDELTTSVVNTGSYNLDGKRYRLSENISVESTITTNVAYELDGNGKQISTKAMIFKTITGKVHDFTVILNCSLTADLDTKEGTDAIAALAEEVHGPDAKISNVTVNMADDKFEIKASNPAGLVVWVWGGATVSNCQVKANIVSQAPDITNGWKLAGGVVSSVSKGTVTQCVFCSGSTLSGSSASVAYYGGIVGGILKKDNSGDEVGLTLTDCTSYISVDKDKTHYGSVLGYSLNKTTGTNYTSDACQGNWWPVDSRAVGTCNGSDETVIGKRSSMPK